MNEKICSKCGRRNSAEMSFCLDCGNSLAASTPNYPADSAPTVFVPHQTGQPNFQPPIPNLPPQPKKGRAGFWLAILGGVGLIGLLLVVGIVGLVAMNWDKIAVDDPPKYSPTPPKPALSPSPVRTNKPVVKNTPPVATNSPPVALHSSPAPTPYTNEKPSTTTPSASFDRVWVDYNVTENGREGMRIHAKFTTYNMKGLDSHMAVYFARRNGEKLTTSNKSYASTEGQVAVFRALKPQYDPAEFTDLTVFMPYDELNLGRGKHALQMDIDVIHDKGGLIQHLTLYDFDYTY